MAPDLNSLPASRPSPTLASRGLQQPRRISFSTAIDDAHSARPHALHVIPSSGSFATRAINEHEQGSMSDANSMPYNVGERGRRVSLGQLHQEIENEQEAQVNRLLRMIRLQQDHLTALATDQLDNALEDQQQSNTAPSSASSAGGVNLFPRVSQAGTQRPSLSARRSSSRRSIRRLSSQGVSPALGVAMEGSQVNTPRDDSAFYQAETQTLIRENQMLKLRIRELERQLADAAA